MDHVNIFTITATLLVAHNAEVLTLMDPDVIPLAINSESEDTERNAHGSDDNNINLTILHSHVF